MTLWQIVRMVLDAIKDGFRSHTSRFDHIDEALRELKAKQAEQTIILMIIQDEQAKQNELLQQILDQLQPTTATSLQFTIGAPIPQ